MSLDYIDTSVYLGMIFEEDRKFWGYLRVVGYKNRNKGVISEYVLGEVLNHVLRDIDNPNPELELAEKKYAIEMLNKSVHEREELEKLRIVPFSEKPDYALIEKLQEVDRELSFDDALHLSVAISHECEKFVTTDKALCNNKVLYDFLKSCHGLKVTSSLS